MPMPLTELLARDLIAWMDAAPDGVPRRVLLWLDSEAQFLRLVPHVEAPLAGRGVRLLCYDPEAGSGQLALKLALLRLEAEPDGRAVVYLPGFARAALEPRPDGSAPDLWSVYEQRYKGCVWGRGATWEPGAVPEPPTLLSWLLRRGLEVADDKTARELSAGGADALLARYAVAQRQLVPSEWPRPLRHSDVLAALAGDPRDALRQLCAAPHNEVRRWGDERELVVQRITEEYGLTPPAPAYRPDAADPGSGPPGGHVRERGPRVEEQETADALADTVAVQLALAEAWDAFGRPDDFPFLSRLPTSMEHRRRQAAFLRDDILSHTDLAPTFRDRMLRLEGAYNLAAWAGNHPGQPGGLPLLARTRWRQFLDRFAAAAAQGWKQARAFLRNARDDIHAASPSDRLDSEVHWSVLATLLDLSDQAAAAVNEAAKLKRAADLVQAFAARWWRADRLHLRVRAACSRTSGLEEVRRVADLIYFDYVAAVSQRFTDLVESEGCWPPVGSAGVDTVRPDLWQVGGSRGAVVITDALRWDLAEGIRERLAAGGSAIQPVVTALPSITPFGMATLMPLAGEVAVDLTPDIAIRAGAGRNLATRDGRKSFLQDVLRGADGRPVVQFVDMDELLKGVPVPGTPIVVVFDNEIDELGHKGTEEFPALEERFIARHARTIELLHAAGIPTVHVVTDHGFLLLPAASVDDLGTPEVLPAQVYEKDPRWAALRPGAPVSDLLRLPLPLAAHITAGFPRGVRTLVKASEFLHGGISPQECVIPHLTSRQTIQQVRVGLDLSVTAPQLSTGTVPAILRPALPQGQLALGGVRPVTVRLWVETAPSPGQAPIEATEPLEIVLRPDVEELRPAVYLREGLELPAGQRLRLRAADHETGEELGSVDLMLLVDWE